jgi:choline-sulfatase
MGFVDGDTWDGHQRNPDITELFRRPVAYRIRERENVDGGPRKERHRDAETTRQAVDFIRNQSKQLDKPWAAYVGLLEPHPSFVALRKHFDYYYPTKVDMPNVPPGHLEDLHLVMQELRHFKRIATPIEEERIRRARAGYYGLVSELDEYIGQIWKALEDTGQLQNTIFIYTSDHGEALGEHGLWYKNNLYDVGIRVPLIIAGAGLPAGKVIDIPVSHVDLVRTLLGWTGASTHNHLRGTDMSPLISDKPGGAPPFVYAENHSEGNITGSFMVRKGDWKYLHFTWYDDLLFNLNDDPGEFQNRLEDPQAAPVLEELRSILNAQVDSEKITLQAFQKEEQMLKDMAESMTEEELVEALKGRLGPGLARNMASRAKGR